MVAKNNPTIDRAHGELKRLSQDEDAQEAYEKRFREIVDHNSRLYGAEMKGRKEGILDTAINFLKMGLSVEQVAQGTKLSIERVQEVKDSLK